MQKNTIEPLVQRPQQEKVTSINDCLIKLQGNMRYQKIFVFFLIIVFISGNRFLTMYPFLQLYPNLKCQNEQGQYVPCTKTEACQNEGGYIIDKDGPYTLNNWMTNLNLVCVAPYEIGLMGTFLFVGQALGALFLTHWADIYGRKKTMMFHGSMYAIVIIASTYASSLYQTYFYIFIIGLLFVPRSSCIFTYIMEITPDKYHQDATLFVYIGDGLTFVISGFFTMYTRDVFLFLILLCISTLLSIVLLVAYLPESPKFQYSKRQYTELQANFEQVLRMNKVSSEVDVKQMIEELKEAKLHYVDHKSSFFDDIKILTESPQHRKSLIAVLGMWIYASFNYYLIGYYVKYFPGDIFVNFLMMTIAEVMAPILMRCIQQKYVTKYVFRYLLYGCSFSSLLFILNSHFGSVSFVPVLILLIRVFVKSAYSLAYYANGKLFPTLVKTSIFSITNGIGRPFSALSTMVTEYTSSPGEIFLVTSLIFAGASVLLPENDNTEQELEKIQESSKNNKKIKDGFEKI